MSKQSLLELLRADSNKFNLMQKMLPESEKPSVLAFLKMRLDQLESLR